MKPFSVSPLRRQSSRGVTLVEMLIGMAITTLVASAVFAGLGSVMIFTSQDEIAHSLREDLYLTMNNIRRDCRVATNVVAKAGGRVTSGTTIVLRQPRIDLANEIVPGEFQWVTYTVEPIGPDGEGGLLRELWYDPADGEPVESTVLNSHIVTLGFMFGGKSIGEVTNLTLVRDIEIILISARDTKLTRRSGTVDVSDLIKLEDLQLMLESGIDFSYLRSYIDYLNSMRVDVVVASSMGAATVRNQRALGLKTPEPPVES